MNDAAAKALGVLTGFDQMGPPDGLAPALRARVRAGIVRRGQVLTWADSVGNAEGAPWTFQNLTAWECADSSFHLEDLVQIDVTTIDGEPVIGEADQRVLLGHGLAAAMELAASVCAMQPPAAVRCIISAGTSNGTFRFHQIRADEHWNTPDLDSYRLEKMIVVDIEPEPQ